MMDFVCKHTTNIACTKVRKQRLWRLQWDYQSSQCLSCPAASKRNGQSYRLNIGDHVDAAHAECTRLVGNESESTTVILAMKN